MQCPRCRAPISSAPDPGGYMLCPACGVRLMSRPAKPKEVPPAAAPSLDDHPPAEALPAPVPVPLTKKPPGKDTAPSSARPARPMAEPEPAAAPVTGTYEEILAEIRALRDTQDEILGLLRSGAATARAPEPAPVVSAFEGFHATVAATPAIRSRRRKSVLLIDDDPASRQAAVAALEQAEVPVRAVGDGNEGLEAIAQDKPDVIVLELAMAGNLAGKDVINMIKATMEWVEIPIVLYTRASVESQKEARTIHGADEVVGKASGPEALVSRVIALFRSR